VSGLETQKIEAIVLSCKASCNSNARHDTVERSLLPCKISFQHVHAPPCCAERCNTKKGHAQSCTPLEQHQELNPSTFTEKTSIVRASKVIQAYHAIREYDSKKFQTVCLLLSTVIEFLKILVSSKSPQAHRSAYIHKITIDYTDDVGENIHSNVQVVASDKQI
jgi:hypothetical protein